MRYSQGTSVPDINALFDLYNHFSPFVVYLHLNTRITVETYMKNIIAFIVNISLNIFVLTKSTLGNKQSREIHLLIINLPRMNKGPVDYFNELVSQAK